MNELIEWLKANKITHSVIDAEVIDIPGFGKAYFEDTNHIKSIFRTDKDGQIIFNSMEDPGVLLDEGIEYIVFKFGNNWYYHNLKSEFALNILKYIGVRESSHQETEFVNLGVHTPYELLNGSFSPKMWVKKAKYCGHTALGICDKNTMAAHYNFQKECDAAGISPVFGYSLTFTDHEKQVGAKVYVQSQQGLQHLLRIQKAVMVDSTDKTIPFFELLNRGEGNVLVLDKYASYWIHENPSAVSDLIHAFDEVFYQVDLSEYKAERIDIKVLEATKYYFDHVYVEHIVEPILVSDCYYLDADDAKNKIILNKVAEGAAHEQSADQYYKDIDDHFALFQQLFDSTIWDINHLFAQCCERTVMIARNATARFDNSRNFMPKYTMLPEEAAKYGTVHNMFTQLLEEGLQRLVPACDMERYRKQMEYEKYIIESTNNVDYLLVQYDTCNWSRQNGVLVGCGRGSAAGSLLLYLLGITLIDPIKYDLIFERFLLPERAGLYPAKTTIIGQDLESCAFVEVQMDNGCILRIDNDAQLIVQRDDVQEIIYADELQEGDDILFDNKDLLFTLNEIQHDHIN